MPSAARPTPLGPVIPRNAVPLHVDQQDAPQPMEVAMEDTVHTLQDRVNTALLDSDWGTLNELIAPDARIIGPKGFIINRDEWIGLHKESEYQQVRLEPTETEVNTYDHVGIRFDVVESECRYNGETI